MRATKTTDDGMTLVELIVAMVVGVLVLMLVGTLYLSMLTNQIRITDAGLSTTQIQSSFTSLQTSVRNASRVEVLSGNLLIAATGGSGSGSTQRCEGWFYIEGSGTGSGRLYHRRVTPAAAPVAKMSEVSASNLTGWTLMVDRADALLLAGGGSKPVFAKLADGAVVIALSASASQVGGSDGVVRLETTVSPLPQSFPASEACFS